MTWLVHRTELTVEQERATTLSPREHRVILGSPGSGKTIVLLHRARHLMDEFGVPPERFRIFVFTRSLKAYIGSALDLLGLPDGCVSTFAAWCLDFYRSRIDKHAPWNAQAKQVDYDAVQHAVWEKTRAFGAADRLFDFILVDEGQDLDARSFEIMKAVAAHVTVCMDHKQQLYEKGACENDILRALGLRRHNLSLLDAYRCSPYIVQIAAGFIRDPAECAAFIEQHPPVKMARQMPLLYLARNGDDEREHLIEMVRSRVDKNERIAILFPTRRHVYGYARALYEAGLEVEVPSQGARRGKNKKAGSTKAASGLPELPSIDFTTALPKLMPYPSAKGLTFDTVMMPRLVPGLFGGVDEQRLERWLFVGITRATQWLYFSTINNAPMLFIDRLQALKAEGQLAIELSEDMLSAAGKQPFSAGVPSAAPTDKDDDALADLF
jgi:superfamily I DNA/RNA helicase